MPPAATSMQHRAPYDVEAQQKQPGLVANEQVLHAFGFVETLREIVNRDTPLGTASSSVDEATVARSEAGIASVSKFLAQGKLERYTDSLIAFGYDDLAFLSRMGASEVDELVVKSKMPNPHARVFRELLATVDSPANA